MKTLPTILTLATLILPLTACEGVDHILVSLRPTGTPTQYASPRTYPADTPIGDPYDVEVIRVDRAAVSVTNRSARDLSGSILWLNDEFGTQLPSLPVGATTTLDLPQFVNHHGERFPVGSLLEPEKTNTIVAADLVFEDQRHKILVRLPENWQRLQ